MLAHTEGFCIHHAGMAVPDLDAAVAWYARVFTFKVTQHFSTPDFKAVFLEREGSRLEIFQPTPAPTAMPVKVLTSSGLTPAMLKMGYTHIAFGVPDVDAAFRQAISRGATAVNAPNTPPGGARFGHVGDLNGNLVELIQSSLGKGRTEPSVLQMGRLYLRLNAYPANHL